MERSPVDDDHTPPRAGAAKALEDESRSELYWRARDMRIPHAVSMSREELIAAIKAASNGQPARGDLDRLNDREVVGRDNGALGGAHIGWVDRDAESATARGELRLEDEPRMVLYDRARRLGIAHTVSMSREELIAAIEAGSGRVPAQSGETRIAPENGTAPVAEPPSAGNGVARRPRPPSTAQWPERLPASAASPREAPAPPTPAKAPELETPAVARAAEEAEPDAREADAGERADRTAPKDDRPKSVGVWSAMRKERFLLILLVVLTALVVGLSGAWVTGALAHQRSVLRVELASSLGLWILAVLMLVLGVRRTRRVARTSF